MANLQDLRKKEDEIFVSAWKSGDYVPSEAHDELNHIQREKIKVLKEKWDKIWGLKLNQYQWVDITDRKLIYNFEFDAVVPQVSQELKDLIKEREIMSKNDYSASKDARIVEKIYNEIEKLGGEILYWV